MLTEMTNIQWNNIKTELKIMYPQLTSSDLEWRNNGAKDLLWMLSLRLKISRKELTEVIENLQIEKNS